MKTTALAFALVAGLAMPAIASQCPPGYGNDRQGAAERATERCQKTEVTELRQKGEEQHKAGEHAASVKTLGEAKQILGIP